MGVYVHLPNWHSGLSFVFRAPLPEAFLWKGPSSSAMFTPLSLKREFLAPTGAGERPLAILFGPCVKENDRILAAFIHDRVAPDVKRARTLTESSSNERECAGVTLV